MFNLPLPSGCSFPGTEAQPAAPANAFGSQQAKSNPAQLSLLQFSPALPVPCTRMCVYSCHPTWAPGTGGSGPGSRTSLCSIVLSSVFRVPARVSVWQVLRGYWEERQGSIFHQLWYSQEEGTVVPWASSMLDMELP